MSDGLIITGTVVAVMFAAMLLLERRFPLREQRDPKLPRLGRNLTLAMLSLIVGQAAALFLLVRVAAVVESHDLGVVRFIPSPGMRLLVAFLLLDYTLWWWHWMSHKVPFLWRFHLVHHIDRDLDASTALRFHFGEHALSILFRSVQIIVIGASAEAVWVWQTILFASILFHHANVRLPYRTERWLVRFVVTPRMHGIHHSDHRDEANSNWSSILSCWDYLHRTALLCVPQSDVVIGVPAYQKDEGVKLATILMVPFVRQRADWDGRTAARCAGTVLAG